MTMKIVCFILVFLCSSSRSVTGQYSSVNTSNPSISSAGNDNGASSSRDSSSGGKNTDKSLEAVHAAVSKNTESGSTTDTSMKPTQNIAAEKTEENGPGFFGKSKDLSTTATWNHADTEQATTSTKLAASEKTATQNDPSLTLTDTIALKNRYPTRAHTVTMDTHDEFPLTKNDTQAKKNEYQTKRPDVKILNSTQHHLNPKNFQVKKNDIPRKPHVVITNSIKDNPPPQDTQMKNNDAPSRPHIVMIVADDLGWNDVDWRDKSMHTPVLTRLAAQGVVLNHSYVQPVCSPTRAAFMSGFYPYHVGLQHDSLRATQKAYLPDNITTLPQHLQQLGYHTHMAGKWHLGFCNWRYTPTYRGFDSFVGFYNAVQDYYTHTGHRQGYDFRYNKDVFYSANGTYSAFVFSQYIEHVISQHDVTTPLFVYLPFQSVHGPLQVPQDYIDRYCTNIKNATRRTHCGMVAALDEAVGNVTNALEERGMLDNTLLLFTTDNGGPVHKGANNWPLRGSKATLWEGGTRAMAFLHGPKILKHSSTTYDGVIHAVDWLPTLVEAAGGSTVTGLDGVSQWQSLQGNKVPSAREEFVYNIDELKKNAAIRQGKYKLLQGDPGHLSGWYPPPQLESILQPPSYGETHSAASDGASNQDNVQLMHILTDRTVSGDTSRQYDIFFDTQLLNSSGRHPNILREGEISTGKNTSGNDLLATVSSESEVSNEGYQLYDLEADPNEHNDVKKKYPDVFKKMRARLDEFRKSLVPANFPPHDPDSYPSNFNGVWSPGWC